MNAYTIDLLAAVDPASTLPSVRAGLMQQQKRFSPLHDAMRDRFLAKYIQTNFGWYIARQYANRQLPFPAFLSGRDSWVHKAYMLCLDPWANYDEHVVVAYHLAQFVNGTPNLRQHLKALLLSFSPGCTAESHLQEVSRNTGVPVATLDAFEILFFNVIDRRADHRWPGRARIAFAAFIAGFALLPLRGNHLPPVTRARAGAVGGGHECRAVGHHDVQFGIILGLGPCATHHE